MAYDCGKYMGVPFDYWNILGMKRFIRRGPNGTFIAAAVSTTFLVGP
jgi:hypothetical protein